MFNQTSNRAVFKYTKFHHVSKKRRMEDAESGVNESSGKKTCEEVSSVTVEHMIIENVATAECSSHFVDRCADMEGSTLQDSKGHDITHATTSTVSSVLASPSEVPASAESCDVLSESDATSESDNENSDVSETRDIVTSSEICESSVVSQPVTPARTAVLNAPIDINSLAASLVLKVRENCHSSASAVTEILTDIESLVKTTLINFSSEIKEKAESKSLPSTVDILKDSIHKHCNLFQNLKTEKQQIKYIQKTFNVVEPLRLPLGRQFKKVHRKGKPGMRTVAIQEELMYIPLDSVCKKLINQPDYQFFVENGAKGSNSKYLDSYMQGNKCKQNQILKEHPDALRFVLYYDDLEVCSPLKSKAGKNKLGAFYVFLDNIPLKYRSTLSVICLSALVNANFIKDKKYGMDCALEQIVTDLKRFEDGIKMPDGSIMYGTLIAFIGDNLGAHAVGGFKEGFTAHRACRFCMATRVQSQTMTKENVSLLRNKDEHNRQCSQVQTPRGKNDALSTEYGVNRDSELNSLRSFHVVRGLPPDILHDALEGFLPLTVKRLLRYVLYECQEKKFTLDWLNAAIRDFDFNYAEASDKPSELKKEYILSDESVSLHQSGAQMWMLGTILPLIIGNLFSVDDKHYNNFLDCLDICRIIFSTDITQWMVVYLEDVIERYLTDFISLYGHLIPKQHHLVHYPSLILDFGSLLNYSCMRCEAKHKFFKKLVYLLNNYKNIPLSLARRHQRWQAMEWSKSLKKPLSCGPQKVIHVAETDFANQLAAQVQAETITVTNWLQFEGNKFVPEKCFICVNVANDEPVFAKILKVLTSPDILFVCHRVKTLGRSHLLSAYKVHVLEEFVIFKPSDMCVHSVLHSHRVQGELYIALKYCAGGTIL